MLSKNKIDKKLNAYVREHLSKGYPKKAVKKVLVDHGYDETYVDNVIRRYSELQFVKGYAIVVSLLFLISFASFNLLKVDKQQVTGFATVISASDEGCCLSVCQQTAKDECYGNFIENKKCEELEECTVGCCIDKEGYCLQNYLYGNCINSKGINIYRDCGDIVFCRNITDKSYWARAYSIKDKKGAGIASVRPVAGYYKSLFNIRYYLYDKTNVISVAADIKDSGKVIDTIELYDDGSHSDGTRNDNLYANNWDSSKLQLFSGFKQMEFDITVTFADGTKQEIKNAKSFVVLNNNKCLPIYAEWSSPEQKFGLIFAAQRYDNLSDGWGEFESDVNIFLNSLFSLGKFSINKELFNVYRLEESLSYSSISALEDAANKSCPTYNKIKDTIIIFDKEEDYCVKEGDGIIRVNPQILFYKNASDAEIGRLLPNFCDYVLTPKKLADEVLNIIGPPKITINTLDNITYNVSKLNISFSLISKNYPVVYSVFLEGAKIYTNTMTIDTTQTVELQLNNGTNEILVDAEDKNENIAYAQVSINTTIQ